MSQGEEKTEVMVFACRESDRSWRALYGDPLTFTEVGMYLHEEDVTRRAQEQCARGSGAMLVRIAVVPTWWTYERHPTVPDAFFTSDGVTLVHPSTFESQRPAGFEPCRNDFIVVRRVRARAQA